MTDDNNEPILGSMTITYLSGDNVVTATGEGVACEGPFSQFVVLKMEPEQRGDEFDHPHLCIATNKIISIRCNVSPTFQVAEDVVRRSSEMRDIMFEHEYQQHQNNTDNQGAWE